MRNLNRPGRNSTDDYDLCVRRSNKPGKTRLQARHGEVMAQYALYPDAKGRPHLVAETDSWGAPDADYQRKLYLKTYDGGLLGDLRGEAMELAEGRCPLCSAAPPEELDHFLPQSSHPALSIYGLNLVFACGRCNLLKGQWCSSELARQFVHPYLEQIPRDRRFLICSPYAGGVLSPQYEIIDHPEIDPALTQRLRWQFERLELSGRYRVEAVRHFRNRRSQWADVVAEGGFDALRLALQKERSSFVDNLGVNDLLPAFMQGLIDCPDFAVNAALRLALPQPPPAAPPPPDDF